MGFTDPAAVLCQAAVTYDASRRVSDVADRFVPHAGKWLTECWYLEHLPKKANAPPPEPLPDIAPTETRTLSELQASEPATPPTPIPKPFAVGVRKARGMSADTRRSPPGMDPEILAKVEAELDARRALKHKADP